MKHLKEMEPQPTCSDVTPQDGIYANNVEVNNRMKRKRVVKEDGGAMVGGSPVNSASSGNIAGIGQPPGSYQGEPGVKKKKMSSFIAYIRRKPPV